MKKIIAAVAACLIIASAFAGCYDPLSSSNTSETKSASSASETISGEAKETKTEKTYSDSFDSLRRYMKDQGFLTDDVIKKANSTKLPKVDGAEYKYGYEYIGAVKGEKYINNSVVIELYEFKEPDKNEYVQSVKKNGKFTLFDEEITAYLTFDDKYMMIYTDESVKEGDAESDSYKTMQNAVKAFEAFKPTK